MLIVVAIIAILIAISIPLVDSALKKAKHATDAANERAAKAVFTIAMLDGKLSDGATAFDKTKVYAYDAKEGTIKLGAPTPYGKHHNNDTYILISVDASGDKILMQWANSGEGGAAPVTDGGTSLCGPSEFTHTP